MKRWMWLVAIFFIWGIGVAEGASADEIISQELFDSLGADALNREIEQINRDLMIDMSPLTVDTVRRIAAEGIAFAPEMWVRSLEQIFFREITSQMHLLGKLLFLAVLCVLMQQLQTSFRSSQIAALSYSVCFIFLLIIGMKAFTSAVMLAEQTIDAMIGFMEALLPLMLFLLTAVGAITSAALFTPLMLFAVNVLGVLMKTVILPMFLLTAVLDSLNYFSRTYRLGQLASLIRQGGMILFGFGMMLFTGLLTVQGVSGGIADGLGLRTAKFAVGNFVPIVGKMFADSVDVIFGASLILKNAIGIFGMVTVATVCLVPLIKLLVLAFLMKAGGALIQPMGEERLANCLAQLGTHILLLFAVTLSVALIFFLTITIIVGVGSMSVMMR
ncbi:MAG: stage III sporulation protein AE [Selenomonadales bacterium]|nr:stage III sporulation protein AE [Selenomonadales bacterium]